MWDLTSKEQQNCEVHDARMELGLAKIAYGFFATDGAYFQDQRTLFPNSNTWVGGGCIASSMNVAQVDYCPQCREAETVWHQVKKLLSTPL
jgi:hypothetical protein